MLPSNKYPTGSRSASVVAARCLIAGLIPLVLAGCEAPLNLMRIPANVTGHSGDRDRFAHGHHAGVSFVL
jgi:hypothetical protein